METHCCQLQWSCLRNLSALAGAQLNDGGCCKVSLQSYGCELICSYYEYNPFSYRFILVLSSFQQNGYVMEILLVVIDYYQYANLKVFLNGTLLNSLDGKT